MQQILCDALPANAQAWVFGSRATWKTKRSSDLDLAIDAGRPLTRRESGDLAEAFDESDLPYKVDLVDMHTVSPTFKAIIERDMVRLERNCARYSKYKEYKETGIEWLPQVPAHWEVKRLKYHAKICNGKDQKNVLVDDGTYPIFGSGGDFGRANEYLYNKLSVLLGRKGTIDRPLFVDQPFWTVDTMFYTKIANNTDPKYFYYSCLCIAFDKYQFGSAIPSMTQEDLSSIAFATPPLPEQKAISAFLDEKTGKIDALLEKLKRQKELLTEQRTSLITRAVTRGLNSNVPMKATGIEWLPHVPAHWEVKRLKYCCDKINPTKKEIRTLPLSTEVSFLPMENIDTKGNFDLSINKPLSEVIDGFTYFKDLDILLAKITPCFENRKGCLVSGLKNSVGFGTTEFHVLRANKSILPEHLYNHIKTNIFMQLGESEMKGSAGQKRVPQEFIENFMIPLPPLPEQKTIAEYLDKQTAKIDLLQSKIDKQIELLKEYRISLITAAVTGQIKISESTQQGQCA